MNSVQINLKLANETKFFLRIHNAKQEVCQQMTRTAFHYFLIKSKANWSAQADFFLLFFLSFFGVRNFAKVTIDFFSFFHPPQGTGLVQPRPAELCAVFFSSLTAVMNEGRLSIQEYITINKLYRTLTTRLHDCE